MLSIPLQGWATNAEASAAPGAATLSRRSTASPSFARDFLTRTIAAYLFDSNDFSPIRRLRNVILTPVLSDAADQTPQEGLLRTPGLAHPWKSGRGL